MQTMRGTEFERALVVWRKKFGAAPSDASERGKQVRFMVSRGFAAEVVRRVVAGADEL
jgi:regulatory protein